MKHKYFKTLLMAMLATGSSAVSARTIRIVYYLYDGSNLKNTSTIVTEEFKDVPVNDIVSPDQTTFGNQKGYEGVKFVYLPQPGFFVGEDIATIYAPVRKAYGYTISNFLTDAAGSSMSYTTSTFYEDVEEEKKVIYWYAAYPRFTKNSEGVWYEAAAQKPYGTSGKIYSPSGNMSAAKYWKYDVSKAQNIVFFGEAEDPSHGGAEDSENLLYSNGKSGIIEKAYVIGELPAGNYTIEVGPSASSSALGVFVGSSMQNFVYGSNQSCDISLTEKAEVSLRPQSGSATFDYVVVYAQGESLAVGPHGWATYCSGNALDFTGVKDIEAYKVVYNSGKNVDFVKIDKSPAGEGVLLKGTKGETTTVTVPISKSDVAKWSDNLLVGVLSSVKVQEYGDNKDGQSCINYVLANQNNSENFYRLTSRGKKVRAHSAYLAMPDYIREGESDAKSVIWLEGEDENETTGINDVKIASDKDVLYNLAGQKVSSDYKGIVIKNGKKFLNK